MKKTSRRTSTRPKTGRKTTEIKPSKAALLLRSRLSPNLTIREIAEHFGISRQAVDAWSRGVAMPSEEKMKELWKVFGIPMSQWKVAA